MSLDRNEIYQIIGVKPADISVTAINLSLWGTQITFVCQYDIEKKQIFVIELYKCQKIIWEVTDTIEEKSNSMSTLGIFLGKGSYQEPFIIATTDFEIVIEYDKLSIKNNW